MNHKELPKPPLDECAIEAARIWVTGTTTEPPARICLVIDPRVFERPGDAEKGDATAVVGTWGIVVADLLQHAASALAQEIGGDREKHLKFMVSVLLAELQAPTDELQTTAASERELKDMS